MRISELEKYKHDTIGKFPMLKGLIEGFEEDDFAEEYQTIIFQAVHEVLIKMLTTSRKMLVGPLKQESTLFVSTDDIDSTLKVIDLTDVKVRYRLTNKRMDYYYYQLENPGDQLLNIEKLKLILPITQVHQ